MVDKALVSSEDLLGNRFVIGEKLDGGRMSSVFLAYDKANGGIQVVVKLLNSNHPDEIRHELFRRETSALQMLSHQNVVRILASGWSDFHSAFYLVLEYIPFSLDRLLKDKDQSQLDRFDRYKAMYALAEGLAYAHSEGVVHRDIKPSNILIDARDRPLLTDFGISKLVNQVSIGETLSGFWSPGYASPEQRSGNPIGPESDIYSLGAVFFHLLSGQEPPIDGPTPDMVDPNVDAITPVKTILKRMLASAPEQRYDRGSSLLSALEVTRRLERLRVHYIELTQNAVRDLERAGYIPSLSLDAGQEALAEDLGGLESEEIHIRRDVRTNDLIILGDSLRLVCVVSDEGDALVLKAVQTPYLPSMEAERDRSTPYRALWEPVPPGFRNEEEASMLRLAESELTEFLGELATDEAEESISRDRRRSRQDFIERWDKVLGLSRSGVERAAVLLEYSAIFEEADYLTFTMVSPVPDNLSWEEDSPLAVTQDRRGRRIPVGSLFEIQGNTVVVARRRSPFQKDRDSDIFGRGFLTLEITEALTAITRQQRAVSSFMTGQMVNPRLAEVIIDPAKSTATTLPPLTYFQEWLSDDKKEAVQKALSANELFLIQGPPGTGKTAVIAELVLQILKMEPDSRILLSSQSNVAVDHALTQIAKASIDQPPEMIRLGRPEKVGYGGEFWTVQERVRTWRQSVLENCNSTIEEMRQQDRKDRSAAREAKEQLSEEELVMAGNVAEWIAEAVDLVELLGEYQREHESLLQDPGLERDTGTTTVTTVAESVSQTQELLDEQLVVLADLLNVAARGPDMANEDYLEAIVSAAGAAFPNGSDDQITGSEKIRRLLAEWIRVVGLTPDFMRLIVESARVVAATCLFGGGRAMPDVTFDWAIIDEAGRATVPEVLIPMVKARRSVLVGDDRQLPPFIDGLIVEESDDPEDTPLDTSLFQSLFEQAESVAPGSISSLQSQYRMHPAIGALISDVFYDGRLVNGVQSNERNHGLDWVPSPVTWISTSTREERSEIRVSESYANPTEADIVLRILKKIEEGNRGNRTKISVGVISAYSGQVRELSSRIEPTNDSDWRTLQIEIATVDSFQGRERDIVIYSTVRSNRDRRIGFLKDYRRVNVALSRARNLLLIVGDDFMMEHATIGTESNPFAEVINYMRSHEGDCAILRSGLEGIL